MPNAGAIGDVAGVALRAVEHADVAAPVRAVFEFVLGESPADRAVSQRHYLVRNAGVDERLGADDRPGASGAIHDDRCIGIRRGASGAKHEFRAGHADRAGNVHGRVLVEPPDIEDRDVGVARDQCRNVVGGQRRRVAAGLDQFAKGLGVGVHVLKNFVAGFPPSAQPAVELTNVGVAQCLEVILRGGDKTFSRVIDDDRHILAGKPRLGFERNPVSRHVSRKQRMARSKVGLVPHIEQRDFIAQQQRGSDFGRGDRR